MKRPLWLVWLLVVGCSCDEGPVDESDCGSSCGSRDGAAGRDAAVGVDRVVPAGGSCAAPGFDPLASVRWDPPAPDRVVTSAADDGPGSLREVLAMAVDGEVIGFDPSLSGETIALTSELTVPASITLDGSAAPGITLDGGGAVRVMSVDKGKTTVFAALRFANGRTDGPGGALHVRQADEGAPEGRVTIVGCTFEDNVGGRGGAVRIGWRINALVQDSVFRGNDGSMGSDADRGFSGGAISTSQDASEGLRIERCLFEGNRGSVAGAVYNILEPVTVTDSVFIGNVATRGSGAFFTDGGNTAGPSNDPETGERGTIALQRVWIEESVGRGAGGAMLLWGYPRDEILLEDVVVLESVCEEDGGGESKGGAARIHGLDTMHIERSVFVRNRSEQQGGALWIDGRGDVTIVNTTFAENHVERDQGGAFTFNGSGALRIASSAFVGNHAGRACGAFWWGRSDQDIEVRNTIFAENTASDLAQRHVREPRPASGGGNLEWVTSDEGRGRIWEDSLFADPRLGELTPIECSLGAIPEADSPVIGAAAAPTPTLDGARRERDENPDIGPIERVD